MPVQRNDVKSNIINSPTVLSATSTHTANQSLHSNEQSGSSIVHQPAVVQSLYHFDRNRSIIHSGSVTDSVHNNRTNFTYVERPSGGSGVDQLAGDGGAVPVQSFLLNSRGVAEKPSSFQLRSEPVLRIRIFYIRIRIQLFDNIRIRIQKVQ